MKNQVFLALIGATQASQLSSEKKNTLAQSADDDLFNKIVHEQALASDESDDDLAEESDSSNDLAEESDSEDDLAEASDSDDDLAEASDSDDDLAEESDSSNDLAEESDSEDDLAEASDSDDELIENQAQAQVAKPHGGLAEGKAKGQNQQKYLSTPGMYAASFFNNYVMRKFTKYTLKSIKRSSGMRMSMQQRNMAFQYVQRKAEWFSRKAAVAITKKIQRRWGSGAFTIQRAGLYARRFGKSYAKRASIYFSRKFLRLQSMGMLGMGMRSMGYMGRPMNMGMPVIGMGTPLNMGMRMRNQPWWAVKRRVAKPYAITRTFGNRFLVRKSWAQKRQMAMRKRMFLRNYLRMAYRRRLARRSYGRRWGRRYSFWRYNRRW